MSGLILFIVAVALLGVAIYSLVSYLKERRAKTKAGLRACLRSVYASEPMTPRPAPL